MAFEKIMRQIAWAKVVTTKASDERLKALTKNFKILP
jgi:hypothetical protein